MTGRERVLAAFNGQKTDRVPWVPFVGSHAAFLLGKTATEYLQSADLIVEGAVQAVEKYRPDGIPVTFDLQIEAETFGCKLIWADENPPAVVTHPLTDGMKLEDLRIPGPEDGRIPIVLEAAKRLRKLYPDLALYGLLTGPFTLALHLLGSEIFMEMFDNPDRIKRILEFCTDTSEAMAEYYMEAGCDIVAVVDPMTSQIGPGQFNEFVTPYAERLFSFIREKSALSSFFVCGHAEQNIQAMCDCRPDNISIDENISLDFVRDIAIPQGISFGGNLQLTSVLLLGTPQESQKNAVACLEIGGEQGFILAPGCDLPYDTPVENLASIIKVVEDPYEREVVKAIENTNSVENLLDMQDYGNADKVIVDIITLDSEACAPCQYMVESVRNIAPEFEGIVEWREHKIKYKESLVFMSALMVRNIPTICIDGQITFVSRIPPKEQLIAAVQKRIIEKLKVKIKQKKLSLKLLCAEGADSEELEKNIDQAVIELGSEVDVSLVTDPEIIGSFGVLPQQTPAVVLARYHLKSVKRIPSVEVIKEWLKENQ